MVRGQQHGKTRAIEVLVNGCRWVDQVPISQQYLYRNSNVKKNHFAPVQIATATSHYTSYDS